MRIGEAAGLQWADLDLRQRLAEVRRTVSKGRATTPKSGKARRVDLSAQLAETLRALLIARKRETLRRGWKEVPPWVFVNEAGNPVDTDSFRARIWPRLFAKAGVRQVRIHDLRHSYASLLIAQGESLAYIRDQMGHHSIRVTVDTYGHLVPSGNKAAVDRLDAAHDASIRNLDGRG
jgi:integrase